MKRQSIIAVESAERAALTDLHAAAPAALRRQLGLELESIDGALVSIAAAQDTILVNRTIGLGVEHPAERAAVADITSMYAASGVGRYFLHLDPCACPAELPDWLEESGLTRYHRGWAKFLRSSGAPPATRSDLEVRRIGPEHAESFGQIAAQAFGLSKGWAPALAGLVGRPGWHVFLSCDGDVAAGCGALRVKDGIAWFDWAATRPEYRRRGSQGAILARRISYASDLGCSLMATATGEAVPGDEQHSYRNILRAGFELSHSRANWIPG